MGARRIAEPQVEHEERSLDLNDNRIVEASIDGDDRQLFPRAASATRVSWRGS